MASSVASVRPMGTSSPVSFSSTGAPTVCAPYGWCWQSPTSVGEVFNAVSSDGRFAVGARGLVYERAVGYHPLFTEQDLNFVATHGDSVWVAGKGIWRNENGEWRQESPLEVSALSISPAGDVWAVLAGVPYQFLNNTWVVRSVPPLVAMEGALVDLAARADGSVWALQAGAQGRMTKVTLLRFSGDSWAALPSDLADYSASFRLVQRGTATYVHDDGFSTLDAIYDPLNNWAPLVTKPQGSNSGLFVTLDGKFLVNGTRNSAEGLYAFDEKSGDAELKASDVNCRALTPLQGSNVLCASRAGGLPVLELGGPEYQAQVSTELNGARNSDPKQSYGTVPAPIWAQKAVAWGAQNGEVWRAPLDRFDGESWSSYSDGATGFSANAIDGSSETNVWFGASNELRRWDGSKFTNFPLPEEPPGFAVAAIRSFSATDTWVLQGNLSDYRILHSDGTPFTQVGLGSMLAAPDNTALAYDRGAIVGASSSDLWVVAGRSVLHFDGSAWQEVAKTRDRLAAAAYDQGDLWVLGDSYVYQLVNGALEIRGIASLNLSKLSLSPGRVWHHNGTQVRTLAR